MGPLCVRIISAWGAPGQQVFANRASATLDKVVDDDPGNEREREREREKEKEKKREMYRMSVKSLCNFKNLLQRQMKRQIGGSYYKM